MPGDGCEVKIYYHFLEVENHFHHIELKKHNYTVTNQ